MDEFDIDSMTGGGGGAGGGAGKYSLEQFNANEEDCKKLKGPDTTGHTDYATYEPVSKLCVTKYNQVSNPTNYTKAKITAYDSITCTSNYTNSACSDEQKDMAYSYSGCKRPVCTHAGAIAACEKLAADTGTAWRLPKAGEMQNWSTSYKKLALCTNVASGATANEVARCAPSNGYIYSGVCGSGHTGQACDFTADPQDIWAEDAGTQTYYNYRCWLSTSWGCGSGRYSGQPLAVRCVVGSARKEVFYSFQGGSGSNAPKITKGGFNSSIREMLNRRIRENVGGKIVFETGEGGKGGESIDKKDVKANNGEDGKRSCIVVKSSVEKGSKDVYRICVPGGKGGYGGDGTIDNLDNEENIKKAVGKGGEEVLSDNNCIAYDYMVNPVSETKFNCTEGSLKGSDGISRTDNPSFLNGNNGTIAGSGGIGGNATKTDNASGGEATLNFGKGGDGAKGAIVISYVHKYEAAGGGGGGGGYVAHITNIPNNAFGKEGAVCTIKIGYGGKGGAKGEKGYDGGDTSIICTGSNAEYKALGGKGGSIGSSAMNAGEKSKAGKGGAAGDYHDKVSSFFQSLMHSGSFHGIKAEDGTDETNGDNNNNYELNIKSAGGAGGMSGTKQQGKCGGLYNEENLCSSPLIPSDDNDLNGGSFLGETIHTPLREEIGGDNPKFGQAGAGGGGGAWYAGFNPGRGGDGQGGYVCIYWNEPES